MFLDAQITLKSFSAGAPAGGAYDATPDPLVGWGGGYPLPIPYPLDDFGVSLLGASSFSTSFC